MTPAEKAKEIFDHFEPFAADTKGQGIHLRQDSKKRKRVTIAIALTHTEHIIACIGEIIDASLIPSSAAETKLAYYKDVEKELLNLQK